MQVDRALDGVDILRKNVDQPNIRAVDVDLIHRCLLPPSMAPLGLPPTGDMAHAGLGHYQAICQVRHAACRT